MRIFSPGYFYPDPHCLEGRRRCNGRTLQTTAVQNIPAAAGPTRCCCCCGTRHSTNYWITADLSILLRKVFRFTPKVGKSFLYSFSTELLLTFTETIRLLLDTTSNWNQQRSKAENILLILGVWLGRRRHGCLNGVELLDVLDKLCAVAFRQCESFWWNCFQVQKNSQGFEWTIDEPSFDPSVSFSVVFSALPWSVNWTDHWSVVSIIPGRITLWLWLT